MYINYTDILLSVMLLIVSIRLMIVSKRTVEYREQLAYAYRKESKDEKYIVVTKYDFLLEQMNLGMKHTDAVGFWDNISKGYEFVLKKGNDHYYSVDHINKFLSKDEDKYVVS